MNPELLLVVLVLGALSIVGLCLTIATVTITAIVFGKDQTALKALDVFKNLFRSLPRMNFPQLPQGGEDTDPPQSGENDESETAP